MKKEVMEKRGLGRGMKSKGRDEGRREVEEADIEGKKGKE